MTTRATWNGSSSLHRAQTSTWVHWTRPRDHGGAQQVGHSSCQDDRPVATGPLVEDRCRGRVDASGCACEVDGENDLTRPLRQRRRFRIAREPRRTDVATFVVERLPWWRDPRAARRAAAHRRSVLPSVGYPADQLPRSPERTPSRQYVRQLDDCAVWAKTRDGVLRSPSCPRTGS